MARPVQMLPGSMVVLKAFSLSRGAIYNEVLITSVEGHLDSATADLTAVLDCHDAKLMMGF